MGFYDGMNEDPFGAPQGQDTFGPFNLPEINPDGTYARFVGPQNHPLAGILPPSEYLDASGTTAMRQPAPQAPPKASFLDASGRPLMPDYAYEPATKLPAQGMWGNWLDNLATSLATTPLQAPNNFGGGLLSGFAKGFSTARLKNMSEREKLQKAMDDYAAQRNAANIKATADAREARQKQLDLIRQRTYDRQKFVFEEMFKAGLKKNDDNTYTVTSEAMLPYLPGVKVGDNIPQSTYNAALNQYLDTKFPKPNASGTASTRVVVTPEAQKIADNIMRGRTSPDELSRFNNRGDFRNQVEVALANAGFNTEDMRQQINAERQFWRTQNSPKFMTIRNNARQLQHSLDLIEQLNTKLRTLVPSSSVPEINNAQLQIIVRQGGPAGRIARQLITQINDTAGEIGGIIMGGNSPTDHALELAASNMKADWSAEDLKNAVEQARYNVGTRLQAMNDASVASAGDNIRAKVGSTFAALRAQGLNSIKDFDKNIDKPRQDGKTLRQALNEQGWSDDDISTLRGKFN